VVLINLTELMIIALMGIWTINKLLEDLFAQQMKSLSWIWLEVGVFY